MQGIAITANSRLFETDITDDTMDSRKLVDPDGSVNVPKIHGVVNDYRELVKEIQNNVGDN